jgi:hypothetical protein
LRGRSIHKQFVDPEARIEDAPSWLMEYIDPVTPWERAPNHHYFLRMSDFRFGVLLTFTREKSRWICRFYTADRTDELVKELAFHSTRTIIELAKRGGAAMDTDGQINLFSGIAKGNGSVILRLNGDQYGKLIAA